MDPNIGKPGQDVAAVMTTLYEQHRLKPELRNFARVLQEQFDLYVPEAFNGNTENRPCGCGDGFCVG